MPESSGAEITSDVIAATSNRIGDQHGERLGFAVTVVALDSGYSVAQIVESPTPNEDGAIDGVEPAGLPLGVLSTPSGPVGFRRPAQSDKPPVGDFRVTVLNTTLEGIWDKAFANDDLQADLDRRTAEAREAFTESEFDILFGVLAVMGRGYTLEQAMESLFFGTMGTDAVHCLRVADELPKGPGIPGAMPHCPQLDPATDAIVGTDESVASDSATDAPIAEGESEPDRPRGVYQATLDDIGGQVGEDQVSVVSNLVSIDLDGEVPVLAVLWVYQLTGPKDRLSPDVICTTEARIEVERAPLVGATFIDGQWSGKATFSSGTFDGTCSQGSQGNQLETAPITVTFAVADTTLTGVFTGEGATLSFAGTLVS